MKKAIITGASSGLGLEIGNIMNDKGYNIVNISRNGSPFINIKTDLLDDKSIENALNKILKEHSDFDTIILNAGIMPQADLGSIDFNIDKVFKINITSSLKILDKMNDLIIRNKADVVIIGSTASFKIHSGDVVYGSSKYAVLGLIKALQKQYKSNDVRVIGFHPGGFNSNLRGGTQNDKLMNPKDLASILWHILNIPRNIQISEIILDRK